METKGDLWIDRDLNFIPVLNCEDQNLDYVAIMSKFHSLLLAKNKKTYKEFVKYWAILIVTAPDPFFVGAEPLIERVTDGNRLFSRVLGEAVKFYKPIETIKQPVGQPKLVEADEFIDQDKEVGWKTGRTGVEERGCEVVNDRQVYNWYTKPENLLEARAFFGLYCLNLLRAFSKSEVSVVSHCTGKFMCNYDLYSYARRPIRSISFDLATGIYLRAAFRTQKETFRKIMRMVIDRFAVYIVKGRPLNIYKKEGLSDEERQRKEFIFFTYAIKTPLEFFGLSSIKLLFTRESGLNLSAADLFDIFYHTGDEKLIISTRKLSNLFQTILACDQQIPEVQNIPYLRCETITFWQYCRLLSPDFLKSMGDEENLELLAFLASFNGRANLNVDDIHLLRKFAGRQEYFQLGKEAIQRVVAKEREAEPGINLEELLRRFNVLI